MKRKKRGIPCLIGKKTWSVIASTFVVEFHCFYPSMKTTEKKQTKLYDLTAFLCKQVYVIQSWHVFFKHSWLKTVWIIYCWMNNVDSLKKNWINVLSCTKCWNFIGNLFAVRLQNVGALSACLSTLRVSVHPCVLSS